ncbi:MAG: hypothetical protein WC572_00870 [Candidatus Omnitrophota bacterium]
MNKKKYSICGAVCLLCAVLISGCSTLKEAARGFAGISTRVLEEGRSNAIRKSFAVDPDACYGMIKEILAEKDKESYIYAEDTKTRMIAVYMTLTDTTPAGIFLSEDGKGHTLIEISSPSTYAREYMADRVFGGMDLLLKQRGEGDAHAE